MNRLFYFLHSLHMQPMRCCSVNHNIMDYYFSLGKSFGIYIKFEKWALPFIAIQIGITDLIVFFSESVPANVPQILINRESLSHRRFDTELLGECDVILEHICRLLGWDVDEVSDTESVSLNCLNLSFCSLKLPRWCAENWGFDQSETKYFL